MNVVKKAKFVLFFDTIIRDLENQAKDLVSRLKNMTVHMYYIFKVRYQLQKYLRHRTLFWLKWPAHDLVLVNPPLPLVKLARPCSKRKGATLNGEKEVGEYFLLQTCDYGSDLQ